MANGSKKNKDSEIPFEPREIATQAASAPPAVYDYSQYANQGFESHTREDYTMPFLGVLQSNSPLVETNASARPGMLFNSVTQELYDGKIGIAFIPVDRTHTMIEWKPRNQGGGFVAQHEMTSELVNRVKAEQEFGKYKVVKGDEKSNDLVETFTLFGLLVNENGTTMQMIISFASTKIKMYKNWMNKARSIQIPGNPLPLPIFAHRYRIKTIQQKNSKGTFYNFDISFDGADALSCRLPTNNAAFEEAYEFFKLLKKGKVKANYETQSAGVDEEAETEVPFK